MGRRLDATIGKPNVDKIRERERSLRFRLAGLIAPTAGASPPNNDLEHYFFNNPGRLIDKWHHYFDIYERHFSRFRGREVTIVEFGVFHGGSLQMWKEYFGPKARIYGIDIIQKCATLAEPQVEILIGDQADRDFLRSVAKQTGQIDILIDDGGHHMGQQLATFEELWPTIADDGVYLIEDLHTSYQEHYGGGYRREGTFIEFAKTLIDQLHAWHSRDPEQLKVDDLTRSIRGIHVYDSVLVCDKGRVNRPVRSKTGRPSF